MSTTSSIGKILTSKLSFWILFALAGTYFLLPNLFKKETENRFALSRLKLGIDLRGGTYITLRVEIEKALENRLGNESRALDNLFKKNLPTKPLKKEIKNSTISIMFDDEETAKICYNLMRTDVLSLRTARDEKTVTATLTPAEDTKIRTESVDQALQVISNRLMGLGVEGIVVQKHGNRQIVVQIPGVDDPQRIKDLITRRAHLEFKIIQQVSHNKDDILEKFDFDLPSDKKILPGENTQSYEDDETSGTFYLTEAYPDLTGDHITDARVSYGEYGQPIVSFKLDSQGGKIFRELTGNNVGRPLGIIIDDVVFSAPNISEAIGSEGRITGRYTFETAKDLAIVLKTGAFQAPVTYQEERRIGPSLGQDSINRGFRSCLVGLGLVLLFSFFYYKLAGLFAMFALLYNLFLIMLFLSYFGATLTLPGIAGMVLTIGMAIDASILIYEKIKEELAEGATFQKAVDNGFSGVMSVIFDSNITTFLTGLVLFYFGGPSIRGFAVTLMVGIVATILSGVFFLRAIFNFMLTYTPLKKINL